MFGALLVSAMLQAASAPAVPARAQKAATVRPTAQAPARAGAPVVASFEERVRLAGTETAAVDVSVKFASAGAISIPLGWRVQDPVSVMPSSGVVASVRRDSATVFIDVAVTGKDTAAVTVQFRTPALSGPFTRRFVNSMGARINSYSMRVSLADGTVARAVTWAAPRSAQAPPPGPMRLARLEGRRAVNLVAGRLEIGEAATLTVDAAAEGRSPLVWIAGLALTAMYLVGFRNVVRGSGAGA